MYEWHDKKGRIELQHISEYIPWHDINLENDSYTAHMTMVTTGSTENAHQVMTPCQYCSHNTDQYKNKLWDEPWVCKKKKQLIGHFQWAANKDDLC